MNILIATDGSDFSRRALDKACELATGRNDIHLRVVCVYEPQVPMAAETFALSAEYFDKLGNLARERAGTVAREDAEYLETRFPGGGVEIDYAVELGRPAQMIVEVATAWGADLIIVGSHGHGFWGRLALGSVSDAVLHHAPCSVLAVKDHRIQPATLESKSAKFAVGAMG